MAIALYTFGPAFGLPDRGPFIRRKVHQQPAAQDTGRHEPGDIVTLTKLAFDALSAHLGYKAVPDDDRAAPMPASTAKWRAR